MNDFDAFAEIALAIFVALTLLVWFLTHLERTLVDPYPNTATDIEGNRHVPQLRGTSLRSITTSDPWSLGV